MQVGICQCDVVCVEPHRRRLHPYREWEHAAETVHLFERDAAPCFPFAEELTFCFATVADGSFPGHLLSLFCQTYTLFVGQCAALPVCHL